jgi:hypothetical protein
MEPEGGERGQLGDEYWASFMLAVGRGAFSVVSALDRTT